MLHYHRCRPEHVNASSTTPYTAQDDQVISRTSAPTALCSYTPNAPRPKLPKRGRELGAYTAKKRFASHVHPSLSSNNPSQKKKCNEKRPQCDRCGERGLQCEYEAVKPRKRRRASFAGTALSHGIESPPFFDDRWPGRFEHGEIFCETPGARSNGVSKWETASSYPYPDSQGSDEWETSYGNGNDVEEVSRTEPIPTSSCSTAIARSSSHYMDLAMIAPSPVASPLWDFSAPVFQEFSDKTNRRALVHHFCERLSHLIVFKEDTGNPFRQLVLPLSQGSSPVMNAIYALSSAHLEYRGIANEEKSLDFHNNALQGLAKLIEQNDDSRREEVLGAIMLLVYYEVLVQRGSSNIVNGHLKGAMTIMKSGPLINTPTSIFLERAFRFYDVIAALSLGTAPNTSDQPNSTPFPVTPSSEAGEPLSPLSAVDTLLGLSTDLWPIIHRLSHLLSVKSSLEAAAADGQTSKATVLKMELESTSQAIENALINWTPTIPTQLSEINGCDVQDSFQETRMQGILNNALAYRHSALVYLYRTIRSQPRSHSVVQKHAHLSLQACSNVVNFAEICHDGPMSALLWPLFVASCEAMTIEDRELANRGFLGTERRQGMNNISRTWEVVQDVWRRADAGDEAVDWRHVCDQMGLNIVFG